MSNQVKILFAGSVVLTALCTGMLGDEHYLHTTSAKSFHTPDPVAAQELSQARALGKARKWKAAATILERNAIGNNVQAKYEYAMLFIKGWGVPRDLEQARNLLLQAVQEPFRDRAKAAFQLGRVYRMSRGEDCARIAFEWFSKAAKWGYAKAHNELGKSYARGIGVEQNIDQALKHYRIAASHNSSSAVLLLVELLAKGSKTLPADPDRAFAVLNEFLPRLEIAAKAGDARAARCIGRLYANNLIMKANTEEALRWFSIAAGLGDAIAMHDMAMLLVESEDAFTSQQEILNLLNESVKRDYSAAITTLGRLHLIGKFGLPQKKAIHYFKQGVAAGHPGSMEELGQLYLKGKHVEHNLKQARALAEQGSHLKHAGSKRLLKKIKEAEAKSAAQNIITTSEKKG